MITPEQVDWELLRTLCGEWLALRYGLREWAYRHVPPRLLCEEVLLDQGHVPFDYRFLVFHGQARLIQVEQGRFVRNTTQSFYTPQWQRLDVSTGSPPGDDLPKPPTLAEMLSAAEVLGAETDFVRVDLYTIGPQVVVGELTTYPGAGTRPFKPDEFDRQLGAWWTPPTRYTQRRVAAARTTAHRASSPQPEL